MREMLDEDEADLSGLSVQQNDGNDEFDIMPIVTVTCFAQKAFHYTSSNLYIARRHSNI